MNYDAKREFAKRLIKRNLEAKNNSIAAGKPGEQCKAHWSTQVDGVLVACTHLPDDEQGILRLSIGGGEYLPIPGAYCNIRGDVRQCIALLEKAIAALKRHPELMAEEN